MYIEWTLTFRFANERKASAGFKREGRACRVHRGSSGRDALVASAGFKRPRLPARHPCVEHPFEPAEKTVEVRRLRTGCGVLLRDLPRGLRLKRPFVVVPRKAPPFLEPRLLGLLRHPFVVFEVEEPAPRDDVLVVPLETLHPKSPPDVSPGEVEDVAFLGVAVGLLQEKVPKIGNRGLAAGR